MDFIIFKGLNISKVGVTYVTPSIYSFCVLFECSLCTRVFVLMGKEDLLTHAQDDKIVSSLWQLDPLVVSYICKGVLPSLALPISLDFRILFLDVVNLNTCNCRIYHNTLCNIPSCNSR